MATSASSVRLRKESGKSMKESSFKGSAGPKCLCNLETMMKISRSEKNPGKGYYNCPKYPKGGCGFFAWADLQDELMIEHLIDEEIGRGHQLATGQMVEEINEMRKELRLMKMG